MKVLVPWKREGSNRLLTILCPYQLRNESIPFNPINQEYWKNKIRDSIPYQFLISSDGTVFPETRYQDICYEINYVRVAANFEELAVELQNKTGFNDIVKWPTYIQTGLADFIGYYYEVVDAFYVHFNVIPIYSDMNQTWGWYDNETEAWTGGVGAVSPIQTTDQIQKKSQMQSGLSTL